jgi:hypothetical protein
MYRRISGLKSDELREKLVIYTGTVRVVIYGGLDM